MEHMQKYVEQRKAHEDKEREYAIARKKEWNDNAKVQKQKHKRLQRKKLFEEQDIVPLSDDNPKKHSPPKTPSKATPVKVRKKSKIKKMDFVEKEKERLAQLEKEKKERIARGRKYGKVTPGKHVKHASPPRKHLNLIGDDHVPPIYPGGPVAKSIIPSPRSPRSAKKPPIQPQSIPKRQTSDEVDAEESRDIMTTPKVIAKKQVKKMKSLEQHSEALSPVLSIPKNKKLSPSDRKLSSFDDSSNSVPNIGTPYKGAVGSEWVSQVMEMDQDESILADVYESGFEMFMIEKGIIQDDSA